MRIRPLLSALALALAALVVTATAASAAPTPGWGTPVTLQNTVAPHSLQLATSGASTLAIWGGDDNRAYASVSQDGGTTWSAANMVSDPAHTVSRLALSTLPAGGFVIAYGDDTNHAVSVRTTNNNGTAWSNFLTRTVPNGTIYDVAVTGITGDRAAVALRQADSNGYYSVFAAVTDVANSALGTFGQISAVGMNTWFPKIIFSGSVLSIAWLQNNMEDFGVSYSNNLGATWSTPSVTLIQASKTAERFDYKLCGDQAVVTAGTSDTSGVLRQFARLADFSTSSWSSPPTQNVGSVVSLSTACLADGSVATAWTQQNSSTMYWLHAQQANGSWSASASSVANLFPSISGPRVALASTLDGGVAGIATSTQNSGTVQGFTWSSSGGFSAAQTLSTAGATAGMTIPAGTPTTAGAAFVWAGFSSFSTRPPVSAISFASPSGPSPAPDPALAATGAAAGLGAQLGWAALGLGVVGAAAIVFAVRRKKRDSE